MSTTKSTVLVKHHLKPLKLPTMSQECDKVASRAAVENLDHLAYLQRLCGLELIERERRAAERRLKAARFPQTKTLDEFDFGQQPSINKPLMLELAKGQYIDDRENVLLIGSSGVGKTHLLEALCGRFREVRPDATVVFLAAEQNIDRNHLVRSPRREAVRSGKVDQLDGSLFEVELADLFFHSAAREVTDSRLQSSQRVEECTFSRVGVADHRQPAAGFQRGLGGNHERGIAWRAELWGAFRAASLLGPGDHDALSFFGTQ